MYTAARRQVPGKRFPGKAVPACGHRWRAPLAGGGGDGERGGLAEAALEAQDDPRRAPDQRAAGGEPGRRLHDHAVAADVDDLLRPGDPQPLHAVYPYRGGVADLDELLEVDLVQVTGEFVKPHLAVRRAIVAQRRDPSAVADRDRGRLAELGRHERSEGDALTRLLERHPLLTRQG